MFRKTVRSKLMKKKPSLGALLHETIQRQWDEVKSQIHKFPYFDKWTDQMIHQTCVHSNILTFEENDLIYVKDDANVYVTYFILEGSATVIQRLVVDRYKLKGDKRHRYRLHGDQSLRTKDRTRTTEFVFMQTCILEQGACFGLGEELSKHTLKANKGLKCLVIPKHIIHQHFTPNNIWKRIILFLDMNYPTLEEVFDYFVAGREWRLNAREMNRKEVFERRHPLGTTLHDVPLTIRAEDIITANKFQQARKDPFFLFGEKQKRESKRDSSTVIPKMSFIDVKDLPELREAEKRREEEAIKEEMIEELYLNNEESTKEVPAADEEQEELLKILEEPAENEPTDSPVVQESEGGEDRKNQQQEEETQNRLVTFE
ncbi:cyclic nucleotide Hypothetical protein domain containing 2 [Nesidiocoris tenuis]|uniref:Cyclic nucleotide-binding domain-containing protein n=1 Tax=Nesidiocoris tenuis TaxID=355587 RepID=A0ABN7B533_9HEMI|nr:cyclic nucleotide Hypothetical protein domain containing 2 [Nesidiocoris tenuis]